MLITLTICFLLTAAYVALMVAYSTGWGRQKELRAPAGYVPSTFISVIVPARNEHANIGACIDAILAQKYPSNLVEIIVVDDHSDDGTVDVVAEYADVRVRWIKLADILEPGQKINAYKKAAITAGIAISRGELIVTTDADCIAPNAWLTQIACLYEADHPAMIVAPVTYIATGGLLPVFQLIDFMSMQGITGAAHNMKLGNMSNGANLAFSKEAFEKVNGYEGVDNLASGDDYLLMMKVARLPGKPIAYLKSAPAIVSTHPQPDWSSFFQQRIRWASKSGKYDDKRLTAILLVVYCFNLSFVVLGCLGFAHHSYWLYAFILLAIKTVAEYIYLIPVASFFRKRWALVYFPFLQPLHILYIVSAGFLGFFGSYKWKDRRVK